MSIKIPRILLAELIAHAMRDDPNECCGLLIGADGAADEVHGMTNVNPKPISRYTMQPGELLEAEAAWADLQDDLAEFTSELYDGKIIRP